LQYGQGCWQELLFAERQVKHQVRRIPFWHFRELTNSSYDLVIIELTKWLTQTLPRQNSIVLPAYVHHILDVRGDWQDVQNRFRKSVRKNELRVIRKYGYEYEIRHRDKDFEEFYDQMYLPTIRDRHGEWSSPMPRDIAHCYFRHGGLQCVRRDGRWVSGGICHPEQETWVADILGVRNGDTQLTKEGAVAAVYYATTHSANRQGYAFVNFRGTGPFMNLGQFQYKRKWGTTIITPPFLHRQTWVWFRSDVPAVARFWKQNPFITLDEHGQLHGVIVVDDLHGLSAEIEREWNGLYVTPGLSDLRVCSVNDFVQNPASIYDSRVTLSVCSGPELG
jgi:hypothetical protein